MAETVIETSNLFVQRAELIGQWTKTVVSSCLSRVRRSGRVAAAHGCSRST